MLLTILIFTILKLDTIQNNEKNKKCEGNYELYILYIRHLILYNESV